MRTHSQTDVTTPKPVVGLKSPDVTEVEKPKMTAWRLWLDHPEKSWVRNVFFQVHFWVGAAVGVYIFVMSVSGSMIVYRGQLFEMGFSVRRIVDLHENLLTGSTGRFVNGIGAVCLTLLCVTGAVIWWPGTKYWRRSLIVEWRANFARINWDLHSAAGLWCFPFVLMWAVSGIYLVFQDQFVGGVGAPGTYSGSSRVHRRVYLLSAGHLQEAIESQPNRKLMTHYPAPAPRLGLPIVLTCRALMRRGAIAVTRPEHSQPIGF